MAAAFGLDELDAALRALGPNPLVLRGCDAAVDTLVPAGSDDEELAATLADLRLVKDDWEISQLASAAEAIARNPGAAGEIRGALILGLVLIESLVIYVLLISLILFFLNPFI